MRWKNCVIESYRWRTGITSVLKSDTLQGPHDSASILYNVHYISFIKFQFIDIFDRSFTSRYHTGFCKRKHNTINCNTNYHANRFTNLCDIYFQSLAQIQRPEHHIRYRYVCLFIGASSLTTENNFLLFTFIYRFSVCSRSDCLCLLYLLLNTGRTRLKAISGWLVSVEWHCFQVNSHTSCFKHRQGANTRSSG